MHLSLNTPIPVNTPSGAGEIVFVTINEVFDITNAFVKLKHFPTTERFTLDQLRNFPSNLEKLRGLEIRMEENY